MKKDRNVTLLEKFLKQILKNIKMKTVRVNKFEHYKVEKGGSGLHKKYWGQNV